MRIANHRIRFTTLTLVMTAIIAAVLLGCGGAAAPEAIYTSEDSDTASGSLDYDRSPAATESPVSMSAAPVSGANTEMQKAVAEAAPTPMAASQQGQPPAQPQAGRQLIVEAWIGLEVSDIDRLVRQVEEVATQRGGWLESSQIYGEGGYRGATIAVRVPADRLANTMDTFRALGRVVDEGITSTDVTERLIDNEAHLTAWYTQEARLITLLENAPTVEDVINIERRLAEVRADIERVEATQRDLANRVATSLITVNLTLPGRFAAEPPNGSLTLYVGDPAAVADAVIARVEALGGFIGSKHEYQQEEEQVVELTVLVKSTDLGGLMEYAATLGDSFDRQLSSVGEPPSGDVPNARLNLTVRSNVDINAALRLTADDPAAVVEQIRQRTLSVGGYVNRLDERRQDDSDSVQIDLELVVNSTDLRAVMDYAATLGKTDNWMFSASGQQAANDAPNARLNLTVGNGPGFSPSWIAAGVMVVLIAAGIATVTIIAIMRRRRSQSNVMSINASGGDAP